MGEHARLIGCQLPTIGTLHMRDTRVWTSEQLSADPHADQAKAEKVRAMFGAIAKTYDLNNRLHSFGQDRLWRNAAVRAAGVTASTRVLDVACGTGDLAEAFAAAGAAAVTGVDFTPEMLQVAEHKAQLRARQESRRKTPGRAVTYEQGDAMNLRFADGSFDVVCIAYGIRNVADPLRALREFVRVLSPGGRVVVLELGEPGNPAVRAVSSIYTRHIMPWTATLIARDKSGAYRYLPRSVSTFFAPAEFKALMVQAGLAQVTDRPLTLGVCRLYRGMRP